ncbi:MAG: GNAT family N-acetyltransferase [Acidobacteria bacterium]|nr:GNAT family N-acetyltransferase [Acidobacteriota bacterium]
MPATIPQQQLDEKALVYLLDEYPADGYGVHRGRVSSESLRQYRAEQARTMLSLPQDRVVFAWEGHQLAGAASWSPLPWDSRHFGFCAARIDVLIAVGSYQDRVERKRRLLDAVRQNCRRAGVAHLSARVQAPDLTSIHALEHCGFELVDGIQTFTLPEEEFPDAVPESPAGVRIGEFERWQLNGVLEIAKSAYHFDRFHADPALPDGAADRLHEDWLRNSCTGQAADLVMVAAREEEVLSFVTVKYDSSVLARAGGRLATIVLVATAANGRGKGIAKATTLATLARLREDRAAAVQVGTQLSNIAAGRLYESCGFRLAGSTFTFRTLLAEERYR